jgi:hypothetical protein
MKKTIALVSLLTLGMSSSFAKSTTTLLFDLDGDGASDTIKQLPLNEKHNRLAITLSSSGETHNFDKVLEKEDRGSYCSQKYGSVLSKKVSADNVATLSIHTKSGNIDGCETGYDVAEKTIEIKVVEGELFLANYASESVSHAHHDSHFEFARTIDFQSGTIWTKEFYGYYQGVTEERTITLPAQWCQLSLKDYSLNGLPVCVTEPHKVLY